MDIIIKSLSKVILEKYIGEFIQILENEPYEYWSKKNFLRDLPNKFDLSLCAFNKNKLLGYIIASLKGQDAYIHKFMVDSNYSKRNIGTRLQKSFDDTVINMMLVNVRLNVNSDNIRAISFYNKNGYSIIGTRQDLVNNIELKIMEKELK